MFKLLPMFLKESSDCMFNKKWIIISSNIEITTTNTVPTLPGVTTFIPYNTNVHNIIGIDSLKMLRIVITNGSNVETNGFAHMGSNELSSAKFPGPKNPNNSNVTYKKKAIYQYSSFHTQNFHYVKKCSADELLSDIMSPVHIVMDIISF